MVRKIRSKIRYKSKIGWVTLNVLVGLGWWSCFGLACCYLDFVFKNLNNHFTDDIPRLIGWVAGVVLVLGQDDGQQQCEGRSGWVWSISWILSPLLQCWWWRWEVAVRAVQVRYPAARILGYTRILCRWVTQLPGYLSILGILMLLQTWYLPRLGTGSTCKYQIPTWSLYNSTREGILF